ncbi:LPS translocon maturation chaperone LptM [Methylocystis parvus]|uniref:LPS translocon maturation chaperone LptM n=1 Tax=Methylocystis parvus TaxID=134 RepID=UPI003C7507B6
MTLRRSRLLILLALAAASLSACGRRGPLELPPEIQARGEALKAEQAAAQAKAARNAPKLAPGQAAPEAPEPPIPGTIGNRPPAQYPFPLDPLL